METGELLKNLRLIMREEVAQYSERMDARFDQVCTLFDGVHVRLDRLGVQLQSINGILERVAPNAPPASSSLRTCDDNVCLGNDHA